MGLVEKKIIEIKERCPKCKTELFHAPGIGDYCPNKNCDVIDNIKNATYKIVYKFPKDRRYENGKNDTEEKLIVKAYEIYRDVAGTKEWVESVRGTIALLMLTMELGERFKRKIP